jgi:bifunctional DNA-binding transcriptional regulator/antitoxin component of YhaV-PrlF toxin-antitoxin module
MKSLKKPVLMDASGRLTMPAEARRELGLEGEVQFVVEIGESEIVLRPAVTIAKEDSWAYRPDHRALLARALADVNEGRVVVGANERRLNKEAK